MDFQSLRYHKVPLNKKIKFVYFDVGNVLINLRGSFKKLADRIGAPDDQVTAHWRQHDDDMSRGTLSTKEYWQKLKTDFHYTGLDINLAEYVASIHSPIVETHKLAQQISKSIRIGLLTNIQKDVYVHEHAKGNLPDLVFSPIIQSWEVGAIKPEQEIFRIAHNAANVEPHEILFVDDLGTNIEQAVIYGMNGYHFDPENARLSTQEIATILTQPIP